jgi:hypothetical protein
MQCYKFSKNSTLLKLPPPGSKMKFKNYKNMLEKPYIVFADLEAGCLRHDKHLHKHVPNSACTYLVCKHDPSQNVLKVFVGENCVRDMMIYLDKLSYKLIDRMKHNEKMIMTKEDEEDFRNSLCCHICEEPLGDDKVRDHCHATGKFRGAAHSKCNLEFFSNRQLPVIFHNLRGYDSHFIINQARCISEDLSSDRFSVIPNSFEKYMSFTVKNLKFIDSYQFMSCSLEKLVENLYDKDDKYKYFQFMKKYFNENLDLLCQKGFYPYEWVDSFSKLSYEGLPPRECFYSKLKRKVYH